MNLLKAVFPVLSFSQGTNNINRPGESKRNRKASGRIFLRLKVLIRVSVVGSNRGES